MREGEMKILKNKGSFHPEIFIMLLHNNCLYCTFIAQRLHIICTYQTYIGHKRRIKAVMYVREKGKITNKEYQNNFSVSRQTATRDLTELVNKNLLVLQGTGKRNAHYTLLRQK